MAAIPSLTASKNLVSDVMNLKATIQTAYDNGKMSEDEFIAANELNRSLLFNILHTYGYQITEGWQRTQTLVLEVDTGIDIPSEVSFAYHGDNAIDRNYKEVSFTYSGLYEYIVKGADNLQIIAKNKLGDENYWPFIVAVNDSISHNTDLISGNTIYIPRELTVSDADRKEHYIFNENPERDPYGNDIRLDSDGNLVIGEAGDIALISGAKNVIQSIDMRLKTEVGAMIKQTAFGLQANVGSAGSSMAIRYAKMAIRTSVMQDPRIDSVDNMIVNMQSDKIKISMDIGLVGYDSTIPVPLEL
jgi:hypothetical protein